jgi:serpin B
MNTWAKDKTQGRIDSIADGMTDRSTRMFLANAVYFKGKWEVPFDVKSTKERAFHLRTGRTKSIPMMEQSRSFSYRQGTGYQAVRLPYQGGNIGMYVILPDTGSSPERLLSVLTGDMWQRIAKPGFKDQKGIVVLPKFKVEYGVELKQGLTILGVRTAFTDKADFSGIAREPLMISAVRQKTFVEVNEEGTEAAAVTGISVVPASIEMNPFEMIVDRPFLFLIEDQKTGTLLFMGVVYDPPGA